MMQTRARTNKFNLGEIARRALARLTTSPSSRLSDSESPYFGEKERQAYDALDSKHRERYARAVVNRGKVCGTAKLDAESAHRDLLARANAHVGRLGEQYRRRLRSEIIREVINPEYGPKLGAAE